MKKIFSILIALLISASAFSQEEFSRNEVRLNLTTTILIKYPKISYERFLNENLGIGASIGFAGSFNHNHLTPFNFTSFARWYFAQRERRNNFGRGFFMEPTISVYSPGVYPFSGWGKIWGIRTNVGLGIGFGWKFVVGNNWSGEFLSGTGHLRSGISVGRRF